MTTTTERIVLQLWPNVNMSRDDLTRLVRQTVVKCEVYEYDMRDAHLIARVMMASSGFSGQATNKRAKNIARLLRSSLAEDDGKVR